MPALSCTCNGNHKCVRKMGTPHCLSGGVDLGTFSAIMEIGVVAGQSNLPEARSVLQIVSFRFDRPERCSPKPVQLQCQHFTLIIQHLCIGLLEGHIL